MRASSRRPAPLARVRGRPAANRALTSLLGMTLACLLVLQVLSAVLFALLNVNVPLPAGPFFDLVQPVHFFDGFLLLPLVALKLGSTGWRFGMYHLGNREYGRDGPPTKRARLLAPVLVASALVLFISGVEQWAFLNQFIGWWAQLHLISACVFVACLVAHLLLHGRRANREAGRDLARAAPGHPGEPGRLSRRAVVRGGLLAGLGLATVSTGRPLAALQWLPAQRVGTRPLDFPSMSFEGGAQVVDATRWRLRVTGAVSRPLSLDHAAFSSLPTEEHVFPLNCVTGWSATRRWRGVPLVTLLRMAGADPAFGHVQVRSTSGYHWDHGRGRVLVAGALLVTHVDGVPLDDAHGFPARLLLPGTEGQSNIKWVDGLIVGRGAPQLYLGPNVVPRPQDPSGPPLPPDPAGRRGEVGGRA